MDWALILLLIILAELCVILHLTALLWAAWRARDAALERETALVMEQGYMRRWMQQQLARLSPEMAETLVVPEDVYPEDVTVDLAAPESAETVRRKLRHWPG